MSIICIVFGIKYGYASVTSKPTRKKKNNIIFNTHSESVPFEILYYYFFLNGVVWNVTSLSLYPLVGMAAERTDHPSISFPYILRKEKKW